MKKERILIVDDEDNWLQTVELILDGKYDLVLTKEPSEALSLIKSSFFSLAILDQRISVDLSGADLLIQLRDIQHDLRAIILTGYAELDDAVESMKVGAADYISKGRLDLTSELPLRVERALAKFLPEESLALLIARGESDVLEFKSSARWDIRRDKQSPEMEAVIIKTVAGFLNSELGGALLIGVDDSSQIIGLQHDYRTLKRQDRDGFENFLVTLLLGAYGKDVTPLLRIDFHEVDGKDVCRISAKSAPKAVFVPDGTRGERFYIRAGNTTRELSMREALEYCKIRGI